MTAARVDHRDQLHIRWHLGGRPARRHNYAVERNCDRSMLGASGCKLED